MRFEHEFRKLERHAHHMYKELTTNTPPCKVSNYSKVTVPNTEYVSRAIIARSKKREEKLGSYQVSVSISDSKVLAKAPMRSYMQEERNWRPCTKLPKYAEREQ